VQELLVNWPFSRKSASLKLTRGLAPTAVSAAAQREASTSVTHDAHTSTAINNHFETMRAEKHQAARTIQGPAKAYIAKQQKRHAAARNIQTAARGFLGRRRATQANEKLDTQKGARALKRDAITADMVESGTSWRSGTFSGLKTSLAQNARSALWHFMAPEKKPGFFFTNSNFTKAAYDDTELARHTVRQNPGLKASLERNKTINSDAEELRGNAAMAETSAAVVGVAATVASTAVTLGTHGAAAPVAAGVQAAGGLMEAGLLREAAGQRYEAGTAFRDKASSAGNFIAAPSGRTQRELTSHRGRGEYQESDALKKAAVEKVGSTLLGGAASTVDTTGTLQSGLKTGVKSAISFLGGKAIDRAMDGRDPKRQRRLNKRAILDSLRADADHHVREQHSASTPVPVRKNSTSLSGHGSKE
jgi:hypothetical protein